MTLVEFLNARLDEDEQRGQGDADCSNIDAVAEYGARMVREVEAKRRLIELHGIVHRNIGWLEDGDDEYDEIPVCGLCVPKHSHYRRREDVPEGPCLTLNLLALAYAAHPDYDPGWKT